MIRARLLVALTFAGACAFPQLDYRPADDGRAPTTVPAGGSGGEGPSTGEPTTTPPATGGGGEAGAEPTSCSPFEPGSCGAEMKCSVVDEQTGELGCVRSGSKTAWTSCLAESECGDGLYCDRRRGVCRPICRDSDDCTTGALCFPMQTDMDGMSWTNIPGFRGCSAYC
ncbi:MAG: hypothetical protein AAGA56_27445, partial [Myxococcota bacterium]